MAIKKFDLYSSLWASWINLTAVSCYSLRHYIRCSFMPHPQGEQYTSFPPKEFFQHGGVAGILELDI